MLKIMIFETMYLLNQKQISGFLKVVVTTIKVNLKNHRKHLKFVIYTLTHCVYGVNRNNLEFSQ